MGRQMRILLREKFCLQIFWFICLATVFLVSDARSSGMAKEKDLGKNLKWENLILKDALYRLNDVRKGLIRVVGPLPLETLNHDPGGKGSSIRQLVNHLAYFELWMMERVRRAKSGEPDLSRDMAAENLPDIGAEKAADFLNHDSFANGNAKEKSEELIERLEKIRSKSDMLLSSLVPQDLLIPIIKPIDENDKNILDLLNHITYHEFIHIGGILIIKGMLAPE